MYTDVYIMAVVFIDLTKWIPPTRAETCQAAAM